MVIGLLNLFRGGRRLEFGDYSQVIRFNFINAIRDNDCTNDPDSRFRSRGYGSVVTGYHDAGEGFRCVACRETGDADDLAVPDNSPPQPEPCLPEEGALVTRRNRNGRRKPKTIWQPHPNAPRAKS